jgi:hypothetical protein
MYYPPNIPVEIPYDVCFEVGPLSYEAQNIPFELVSLSRDGVPDSLNILPQSNTTFL